MSLRSVIGGNGFAERRSASIAWARERGIGVDDVKSTPEEDRGLVRNNWFA
jgi:hypothetical protein